MHTIINEHEANSVGSRLTQISKSGGTNSKPFWNIVRKNKQNNLEDLYVIKTKEGKRMFNELETKQDRKQNKTGNKITKSCILSINLLNVTLNAYIALKKKL